MLSLRDHDTNKIQGIYFLMKCPRDQELLECQHLHEVEFQVCRKCGGLWIEETEFEEAIGTNDLPIFVGEAKKPLPERHDPVVCPAGDDHKLLQQEFHGIQIDTCPEHKGIWFDGGELARLVPLVKDLIERDEHHDIHKVVEALFPEVEGEEHGLLGDVRARFAGLLMAISRSYGDYGHWMMP